MQLLMNRNKKMHGVFLTLLSMFGGHSEGQFDDLLAGFAPPSPKASLGVGLSHELVSGLLSRRLFCARSSLASGHFVNCSFFGQRWSMPPGGSTRQRLAFVRPMGPKTWSKIWFHLASKRARHALEGPLLL
jgi:hypothetical protein